MQIICQPRQLLFKADSKLKYIQIEKIQVMIKSLCLTTLCMLLCLPLKAVSQDNSCSCSKDMIPALPAICTPTPGPTVCQLPQVSLSTSLVNLSATISVAGNYNATYSASAAGIVNITASPGAQLAVSGGSGVSLVGNAVNFAVNGVASKTINAHDSPGNKCTGMEPRCAKPCNFGGCYDCNCSLRPYNGGHMYGWTNVYRYNVNFSNIYTVTATNACGSASANFTVAVNGSKSALQYYEQWATSPVSLNLTGAKLDIGSIKLTKVNFKLSEKSDDEVYWLASSDTPLLVWDPDRLSRIEDGRQLFGTWTFGKQWETGYHALASLDKDDNSLLQLDELRGIRIWLDANKNGVSEDGEIADLDIYGITEISVKFNRQETLPVHGILAYISDKGFRYSLNGRDVWAESFDWIVPLEDDETAFRAELKRLEEQGYMVKEWAEDPFLHMNNRSFGYLLAKREANDRLAGYYIRALKSDGEQAEYSLYSTPISGTWSDSRFDFIYNDNRQSGPISETIKAYARIDKGVIIPEKLEIIHSQGSGSEMKREAKWKLIEPAKPF